MTAWAAVGAGGKFHRFDGRLVMVGFGSVGQGVLPLLMRHVDISPQQILILKPGMSGAEIAQAYGVPMRACALTAANLRETLGPCLGPGDFLLNLSVDVSTVSLIEWCHEVGALYLDTCIEPWAGGYVDATRPPAGRTNYALREAALALRRPGTRQPTAVLTHGANPGLASHFVKQGLLEMAARAGHAVEAPTRREDWARLAWRLGVRVIHVAERDTQVADRHKGVGEFVNTWSVHGFVSEGLQPAELGWGSHEREFPPDGGRHECGSRAAIYLRRPGAATRVRSWTPLAGAQQAFLITHGESISIADYLTLGDPAAPDYRPTVLYAYHPCDDAVLSLHELAGRNWRPQPAQRILKDDIVSGVDALGVLLMGPPGGACWYGSMLDIRDARAACPLNSATSLQVTSAVMAAVVWAMRNPQRGVVEPDDLPFDEILGYCRPYLGDVGAVYTDWTPLTDRSRLYDDIVERDDPWQFRNFRFD